MLRIAAFLMIVASPLVAQQRGAGFGAEVQAYPAGVIGVARVEFPLARRTAIGFAAGYNLTDRRDFGEHDDEQGGGFGAAVLVTARLGRQPSGFYLGGRVDVWRLDIDWEDRNPSRTGSTAVTVIMPTARAGYSWSLGDGGLRLDAGVALGAEVNVRTRGEPVGEGAIVLGGVSLLWHP